MVDVFEGMHWLCFHLEFEHDNHDPDEPCGTSACPWNRIQALEAALIRRGCTQEDILNIGYEHIHGTE